MILGIRLDKTQFVPGEEIRGTVTWKADGPLEALDLRLSWKTQGKANSEWGLANEDVLEKPASSGEQAFVMYAPEAPYSFSGKLVSLIWTVSVRARPSEDISETEVTISPTGSELILHRGDGTG